MKPIAEENFKTVDKEIKNLVRKLISFFLRVIKAGCNNNLDSHHINHKIFKATITTKNIEIEKIHVINKMKEIAWI